MPVLGNQTFIGHDDELGLLYLVYDDSSNYLAFNYETGAWGVGRDPNLGFDAGSFLNASTDDIRGCGFFGTPSVDKSACIVFGQNPVGTRGWPKFFRDGVASNPTWTMPWVAPTAKQGGQLSAIYPIFHASYQPAGGDAFVVQATAFRSRATGPTQGTASGSWVSATGKVDIAVNGTMFKFEYAAVNASDWEFLGHEPEYSDASPRR